MTGSPLTSDIAWLNDRLAEVDPGEMQAAAERIGTVARAMLDAGSSSSTPDGALAALDFHTIHAALKLLTIRFHLRNKAEQVQIARINAEREVAATADAPRAESIAEAVATLQRSGTSCDQLLAALGNLDIQPTLTAHPTESRRRSVVEKQHRIAQILAVKNAADASSRDLLHAASDARQTLSLLLATDEVRSRRLDVIDEVRNGIHFLAGAIWDAVPRLYRDLREAIQMYYGDPPDDLPVFLRYRSWIGGDRDGNPKVSAALTRRAFTEMRSAAIARHAAALARLRRDLSISNRRVDIDPALLESIAHDSSEHPIDADLVRHLQYEPFRVKIRHMQARLGSPAYTQAKYIDDLHVLQRAVAFAGLEETAQCGLLFDAIVWARTFGFHLAALDIRQHSQVHEHAVDEMLSSAGVTRDYATMDESRRREVLCDELTTSRPLLGRSAQVSPQTRELLDALEAFAEQARTEPGSVGSYIVSMTHEVSDILEVLLLLREVGLWSVEDGEVTCPVDVAPLFETVDDLSGAHRVMQELFDQRAYAAHLAGRNSFQEIMLGYSDSNKDGGYWVANWRLHRAQETLARACADANVTFRFFHGRGGTVARGGGRAHRAILASPQVSRNGRIRFTEQGEVISFRYAMPAIAHRHLEQIANAMILTAVPHGDDASDPVNIDRLMNDLADRSRTAYRALIDDKQFWPWFVDRSPVLHIGELPIASRPVSRSGGAIEFANLRAIPWVFAWTQMRYNTPGWFGIGSAFEQRVMDDEAEIVRCQRAYQSGGCFRAFIDNAQQEMARARLPVAHWYAGEDSGGFHRVLAEEFGRAERAILTITGQSALLDNNPVIQQSIFERNPDTDIINALQVELLRRWRSRDVDADNAELKSLIYLSVNALAAAMQSTG